MCFCIYIVKPFIALLLIFIIPCASAIDFSYEPVNPTTSTSIHFNASFENITPVSYVWDFGDGKFSSESSPYHRYSDNGNYTIVLTIVDDKSIVYQCNHTIYVNNTLPNVDFTWDIKYPNPKDSIHFTDLSNDADGNIVAWRWDMGDGGIIDLRNHTHAYVEAGMYNITLTVWDDDGGNASKTKQIIINENEPPDAVFVVDSNTANVGDKIEFHDASIDIDGEVVSWNWSFGDGSTSNERNPVHVYKHKGDYTVTLTVKDDDGAVSSYSSEMHIDGKSIPAFTTLIFFVAILISCITQVYKPFCINKL